MDQAKVTIEIITIDPQLKIEILLKGENIMPWEGKSKGYDDRADLPIKHDAVLFCDHCNEYIPHEVTSYKDADYRVCKKCGMRTKWIPVGKTMVKEEEQRDESSWKDKSDQRRDVDARLGRPKGSKNRKRGE